MTSLGKVWQGKALKQDWGTNINLGFWPHGYLTASCRFLAASVILAGKYS